MKAMKGIQCSAQPNIQLLLLVNSAIFARIPYAFVENPYIFIYIHMYITSYFKLFNNFLLTTFYYTYICRYFDYFCFICLHCNYNLLRLQFVVSGPCGGKTTGQSRLCTFFENLGWKVSVRDYTCMNLLLRIIVKYVV